LKVEFIDAGRNERQRLLEVAVDEDVALRRGDEISREVFGADAVEVPRDLMRRKGLDLGCGLGGGQVEGHEEAEQ